MRVLRSPEPNLIYVLVRDDEARVIRKDLRKGKSPLSKELRVLLKKMLR